MEGQDRGKDRRRSSITAVALPRHGFFYSYYTLFDVKIFFKLYLI